MIRLPIVCGLIMLVLLAPACTSKRYNTRLKPFSFLPLMDMRNNSVGRMKTQFLAGQINENLNRETVKQMKIAVLPFADLEHLNATSSFGQFMGEQLIFELSKLGFNIIEIRSSHAVYLAQKVGELFLQRTNSPTEAGIKRLGMDILIKDFGYDLDGLVCGTYIYSREHSWGLKGKKELVYVNSRLIRLPDQAVLSAASAELAIPIALKYSEQLKELEEVEVAQKSFTAPQREQP